MNLNSWDKVEEYVNLAPISFTGGYIAKIASGHYPFDAFSLGQLASKAWLLREYAQTSPDKPYTVAILGCWVGTLVEPLIRSDARISRIWGFDSDPDTVKLAESFNQGYVQADWLFKGVIDDVNTITWRTPEFVVDGMLIDTPPDVVINTSCEHMGTDWFDTVGPEQLVVMQTNNNSALEGHINTCSSINDMQEKYKLRAVEYCGELVTPLYTRYMQIGYK